MNNGGNFAEEYLQHPNAREEDIEPAIRLVERMVPLDEVPVMLEMLGLK